MSFSPYILVVESFMIYPWFEIGWEKMKLVQFKDLGQQWN